MKFKILLLTGVLILMSSGLFAASESALISVRVPDEVDTNLYDEMKVIHITSDYIIAEATSDKLVFLQKEYEISVLDEQPWSEVYYLITNPKKGKVNLKPYWGEEIFNHNNVAILKTDELPLEELVNNDLLFVEMRRKPLQAPEILKCPVDVVQSTRGIIDDLIADVNPDSVESYIQSLQDFQTRYAYATTRDAVAQWIADKFSSFGFTEVEQDSFYYSGVWHKNVVAVIPGTVNPDEYIFIGGHHDSIVHFGVNPNPMILAPGADDNGSSVAGALEMARVLMEMDYEPDITLVFCTFGAEEIGLVGSWVMSTGIAQEELNLRAMINADMIAHNTREPDEWIVDIYRYTGAEHLYDLVLQLMPVYTSLSFGYSGLNSSGSDSYTFWANGYDPVYFFENEFCPYYHSNEDLVINCDIDYCAEIIKLQIATLISLESMPSSVRNYEVYDVGNGSDLYLSWNKSLSPDIDFYEIGIGTSSGAYTSYYTTNDSTYTLTDLTEGQLYYIGVSAVNIDGTQSFIVEKFCAPESLPRTPDDFAALAEWFTIELNWSPNYEVDLDGYNLYRSTSLAGTYDLLNTTPLSDTTYVDNDVISGQFYYYYLNALDDVGNISPPTDTLKSRAVTLDQGVLLVDDTKDGNGSFMYPTEAECDLYYDELLNGFTVTQHDTYQDGQVSLADIGAYSTVFWYIDEATATSSAFESESDISAYLELGGQLLLSGFRLTEVFSDQSAYPRNFEEGEFCYDYLKLSEAYMDNFARFYFADPTYTGFEPLYVDTTKTLVAADYHMFRIESCTPNDESMSVYNYESLYEDPSQFAVMNGMPVSSAYFGADFKTFILNVPLYYIRLDDARTFVTHILTDYFGETVGISVPGEVPPHQISLYQNYPNPISSSTVFRFAVPPVHKNDVCISIYNLKGQIVRNLSPNAEDNEIIWDGKNARGEALSNGIYMYSLIVDDQPIKTKKLLIFR